ncbi:putative G-protein coupled receptor 139 [Tubulanus polymorphus]|uniref:putative G-protein coupled receptor 139 n=1 Tax=Tubulanus polymorphus TaxID=672921 RepID=UPI003DA38890
MPEFVNGTREEACAWRYGEWSGRFYINIFALTPILIAGWIMNSLIIAIFTHLKSTHPSIHLLKCLAFADISLLFSHFIADTLRYLIFYINYGNQVFIPPFFVYPRMYAYGARVLRFGFMYERNWLTVLIQLERLLTILYPLKASRWWTKTRMNRIIATATLLFFAWSLYFPLTVRIVDYNDPCHGPQYRIVSRYPDVYFLCNKLLDPVLRLIVPSAIILVVNTALIFALYVKFRQRKQLGGSTGGHQSLKADSRATRMVISMSITFLLLEMPETFSKVRSYALPNAKIWELAMDIAYITSDLDSCVNFILYCTVNKQFYQTLKKLTCRITADGRNSKSIQP